MKPNIVGEVSILEYMVSVILYHVPYTTSIAVRRDKSTGDKELKYLKENEHFQTTWFKLTCTIYRILLAPAWARANFV